MAQGHHLGCTHCDFSADAWSDANPYYLDEKGEKRYAYHPSKEAVLCTEADVPHICRGCAHIFDVDSAAPNKTCPKCNKKRTLQLFNLLGTCPACKEGEIIIKGTMIS